MLRLHRRLVLAALLVSPSSFLVAQSAADLTGHWEGAIKVPEAPVTVEVDLVKSAKGELAGTFSNPAQKVKGLPLTSVVVDGKSIRLLLKAGPGGGTFDGVLSDNGKSISGVFNTAEGGYSIPFSLTRTGDAKIEEPAKSPPIRKELEGTWNGTLDVNGTQRRLVLTMSNQPDGTSSGSLLSVDGGGLEFPILIAQKGTSVTLDVKMVSGSYAGTVNADGTEMVGTWTQGTAVLPLTFKHTPRR